jgi:hypothetical protein
MVLFRTVRKFKGGHNNQSTVTEENIRMRALSENSQAGGTDVQGKSVLDRIGGTQLSVAPLKDVTWSHNTVATSR